MSRFVYQVFQYFIMMGIVWIPRVMVLTLLMYLFHVEQGCGAAYETKKVGDAKAGYVTPLFLESILLKNLCWSFFKGWLLDTALMRIPLFQRRKIVTTLTKENWRKKSSCFRISKKKDLKAQCQVRSVFFCGGKYYGFTQFFCQAIFLPGPCRYKDLGRETLNFQKWFWSILFVYTKILPHCF